MQTSAPKASVRTRRTGEKGIRGSSRCSIRSVFGPVGILGVGEGHQGVGGPDRDVSLRDGDAHAAAALQRDIRPEGPRQEGIGHDLLTETAVDARLRPREGNGVAVAGRAGLGRDTALADDLVRCADCQACTTQTGSPSAFTVRVG